MQHSSPAPQRSPRIYTHDRDVLRSSTASNGYCMATVRLQQSTLTACLISVYPCSSVVQLQWLRLTPATPSQPPHPSESSPAGSQPATPSRNLLPANGKL